MFKYSSVAVPSQPEAVPDMVPCNLNVQVELHQAQLVQLQDSYAWHKNVDFLKFTFKQ